MGLSGMLITSQEKERSRLASEIHDDFSQRLALLAFGLENAEEAITTLPGEAVRQMHSPLNSASEIGADLHTFRIVSILDLSEKTVEFHKHHIYGNIRSQEQRRSRRCSP